MMYAQAHPSRVSGLILRGVYDLSQPTVIDEIFPEIHDEIDQLANYKKGNRFKHVLHALQTRRSRRLANLLVDMSPMYVKTKRPKSSEDPFQMAIVNAHYEKHHYFVPIRQIYHNMYKIRHIPTFMVNGRWDIVTPARIAYDLSRKMDNCTLIFVDAGHTVFEKAIGEELVKCSDLMSKNAIKKA
jgi:proline iminopeptidase